MTLLATNWYKIFYWVTVADGVKRFFDVFSDIFTWFAIISFVIYIIMVGIRSEAFIDNKLSEKDRASMNFWIKRFGKTFWISMILCMIMWMGYMVTPTKKDALIIISGGAVGNFIVGDSSAKQIPAEMTNLLREKLRSEIKELKEGAVSKVVDTFQQKTKEELIELLKQKK